MEKNLGLSLAVMRLSVGVFFMIWAVRKLLEPESSARVSEVFYGFTPEPWMLTVVGVVQIIVIALFMLGRFKTLTYGSLMLIHTASVLSTWQRLIDPYTSPNTLFWAGVPIIALLLALFLLREHDTVATLK